MMSITILSALLLLFPICTCETLSEYKRVKRVSSSVMNDGSDFGDSENFRSDREAAEEFGFPISLPPYNKMASATVEKYGSCLLYLESLTVFVFNSDTKPNSAKAVISGAKKNKFSFDDSYVSCLKNNSNNRDFSFRINVNLGESVKAITVNKEDAFTFEGPIDVALTFFVEKDAVWKLQKAELKSPLVIKGGGTWLPDDIHIPANAESINAKYSNIGAFKNYNYACSGSTIIAWRPNDSNSESKTVGISLNNIQLQAYDIINEKDSTGKMVVKFSSNVNDCVGTFSVGSWMGIVVMLVLLGVLTFGYLMLNSVQTMDRFDDPKQKQLIINAKD